MDKTKTLSKLSLAKALIVPSDIWRHGDKQRKILRDMVFLLVILFIPQIGLSQINLDLTIDAHLSTPMKLSDISEHNHYMTVDIDNVLSFLATDSFLFISQGVILGERLNQFDLSGKLIQTFADNNNKFKDFICDLENNRLILIYNNAITVWDLNGHFIKTIRLPENSNINGTYFCSVIGFKQNDVWILQHYILDEKYLCQISRMNIENEQMEIILERIFPVINVMGEGFFPYKAWFSSIDGRLYVGFHDDIVYEVDGTNVSSAVNYSIRNYKQAPLDYIFHEKKFAGRYFYMLYGDSEQSRSFLYDTKENRTWQFQSVDGIEDDIFHTGKYNRLYIKEDYMTIRRKGSNLPKEMNIEENQNVFFIIRLKR